MAFSDKHEDGKMGMEIVKRYNAYPEMIDLIGIIQALIIVFIAAPLLVRAIFPWGFRKDARKAGGTAQ